MNIHIELVKKWLADNDSVTLEELRSSETAARDAYLANDWAAYWAAAEAAAMAYWTAYWAYRDTDRAQNYKQKAIKAIARYEELTK